MQEVCRSKVEIAQLVLDSIKAGGIVSGLCLHIRNMATRGEVSASEATMFRKLIVDNRPLHVSKMYPIGVYYWERGHVEPRIRFLEKIIEKYQFNDQQRKKA